MAGSEGGRWVGRRNRAIYDLAVLIDALLMAKPNEVASRAEALAAAGVDGIFTFEGPHDLSLIHISEPTRPY